MQKVHQCIYSVKVFTHKVAGQTEDRHRPLSVVALLYGNGLQRNSNPVVGRNVSGKSLATLSTGSIGDDNRLDDFFLPLFDHGHLLGRNYGGSDESRNLVPMLRSTNRGGDWATFERAIAARSQPSIVAIRCIYDDANDPRIPVRVKAALLPISKETAKILDDNWPTMGVKIKKIANFDHPLLSLGDWLSSRINFELGIDIGVPIHAEFKQNPFLRVQPFLRLSTPSLFYKNLRKALIKVHEGWLVENQPAAKWTRVDSDDKPNDSKFTPTYRLPPPDYRPYAALDYMALNNQLDDQLVRGRNKHDITNSSILKSRTFNAEMRSFAMYVNLYMYKYIMSQQRAYLSDAWRHAREPDPGTAGAGIVLDPEFDHIIPYDPRDGLLPGPTMFSNLQIISPMYNTRKSNQIWVDETVMVGWFKPDGMTLRKRNFEDSGIKDKSSKHITKKMF